MYKLVMMQCRNSNNELVYNGQFSGKMRARRFASSWCWQNGVGCRVAVYEMDENIWFLVKAYKSVEAKNSWGFKIITDRRPYPFVVADINGVHR